MEKWRGETENQIRASEIGHAASIQRQRKDLIYRQELEGYLIDIFNAYDAIGIKSVKPSVQKAWAFGKVLSEILEKEETTVYRKA